MSSRRRGGRDECVWCDAQGRVKAVLPLPRRGHSFAIDGAGARAVVFGRQPGFFALAFRLAGPARLEAEELVLPDGHHFYGHGVFAPDGDYLYATENDYRRARGVIGVYDARAGRGYRRVGEFETGGKGPHEVLLMPDGETLCVANGGMETHPDYGKSILNAATMQPSLAYLDRRGGRLLELRTLADEWRHLSIRHLAIDRGGQVWAGCQYANPDGRRPALVLRHSRGGELLPPACPPDQWRAMRNYVGSVTANARGTVVATSSPLGGRVLFWDAAGGHLLDAVALPDVCGVAPHGDGGFLLSSGHGVLAWHKPAAGPAGGVSAAGEHRPARSLAPHSVQGDLAWDNHMRRV
ncbi:DUF1513 domain-containing protein [Alcaligenaceae bacterium]|nr:DUF1513 domain-containing protein [Alcaligenaceae bacterium]